MQPSFGADPRNAFISHVHEDEAAVECLARHLEAAGVSAWYYERDSLPGLSYLDQTCAAIEAAGCFVFLLSPASVERHREVHTELVRAYQTGKPIIPVLKDIDFPAFREARPEWHHMLSAVVCAKWSNDVEGSLVPALLATLRVLQIGSPGGGESEQKGTSEQRRPSQRVVVEDAEHVDADDDIPLTAWDDVEDEFDEFQDEPAENYLYPVIVHEHRASGFLADLIVPDTVPAESDSIRVELDHDLLSRGPCRLEIRLPTGSDPVQYLRLPNVVHGFPVVLRLYWMSRLPEWSSSRASFASASKPAVEVVADGDDSRTVEAAGFFKGGRFVPVVPANVPLPHTVRKRIRTARDNQKALSLTPAVRTADGAVRTFRSLKSSVPPAAANVAWMEFAFRVDPDGRFTVFARDPLQQMRIRDVLIVQ